MRWVVVASLLAACANSNTVVCGDGRTCPGDRVCDPKHTLCVFEEQTTVCIGKPDREECTAGMITGHCLDEVCLPSVCGDGVTEFAEQCDDHNTIEADMCSADCTSTRVCGNGVTDTDVDDQMRAPEQCDDGNLLDHDGCSSQCLTESAHWVEHTIAPLGRHGAAYAYDSRRARLVIFGGETNPGGILGDTLEWNGYDWSAVVTQGPAARRYAAATYDVQHGEVVLFGGFAGTMELADTWTYDGKTWSPHDTTGPTERYGAVLVYDPKRKVSVLFGGYTSVPQPGSQSGGVLDDTWEWDGASWKQITTNVKPPKRAYAAATYDPKAGVIVMAGGGASTGSAIADTWTYNGTWTGPGTGTQPAEWRASMAFDPVGHRTLMFGGLTGATDRQRLWSWNGSAWTDLGDQTTVPARNGAVMANTGSQVVLFGGSYAGGLVRNDTWLFKAAWASPVQPDGRYDTAAVTSPLDANAIFFGGSKVDGQSSSKTWAFSRDGYADTFSATPGARYGHMMAWDSTRGQAVLFGGTESGDKSDTWVGSFTGANWSWTQKSPTTNPGPTSYAQMGFDGSRVILFRPSDADANFFGDTWAWDGMSWTKLAAMGPTDRIAAAIGYDPLRKQLVMFGGYCTVPDPDDATNYFSLDCNDTWIFDGSTWTQAMTPFRPGRRFGATLTWNPTRQRLVLAGGDTVALDSYEWDGTTWNAITASNIPFGRSSHAAVASPDGAGITIVGGADNAVAEQWELRWDATPLQERCDGTDADGDSLRGCADPDCWMVCAPRCAPGAACDATASPRCGDDMCQAPRESCRRCEADCGPCTPVCGDFYCDSGETSCPGDCP